MIEKVYYRKMPTAEAIRITEKNMHVVAAWISMKIKEMRETVYECNAYECNVENDTLVMPTSSGIDTGSVGDWAVVKAGLITFYTDEEFDKKFTIFKCHAGVSGVATC